MSYYLNDQWYSHKNSMYHYHEVKKLEKNKLIKFEIIRAFECTNYANELKNLIIKFYDYCAANNSLDIFK